MTTRKALSLILVFALLCSAALVAQTPEPLDYAMIGKIRDEGLQRSQVMEHIIWLSDIYGPRLTGSPAIRQASAWAQKKFGEWGLANIHEEEFPFGKGWSLTRFDAHMTAPQVAPLIGYPKSWTPGTQGRVSADVVLAPIKTEADFEKYRGKLKGKIVLSQAARAVRPLDDRIVLRMNEADIREAMTTPVAPARTESEFARQRGFQARVQKFFLEEGVVAVFDRGSDSDLAAGGSDLSWRTQRTDGGTIFVQSGGARDENAGKVPPQVVLAVEHYNRMIRILERRLPVTVELNIQAEFHGEATGRAFNLFADIPGTDLANEVVMIGAHFDSHHAGTGATDNATGSAAMMEVMRILKTVGAKPRRTIRLALWGGEEQGLLGSRACVKDHFGDPATMSLKPGHQKLAAYFNLDNGTGRVRGIWSQGNLAVMKIFEQWADPLRDLGVTLISPRGVTSTDHLAFDAVGLPGFQFVQERLEYNSRTHHSNMDHVDHVIREEVAQTATVAAVFAYNAATRAEKLPRKALPPPSPQRQREPENEWYRVDGRQ
ncbi:MAG: M20/M25/M40 family metallo-hydrolase [Blastocatellia bacterium]